MAGPLHALTGKDRQLCSFIGLTYYQRFIRNYARVAGPLHAVTGKDRPFVWDDACQKAFDELKKLLTTAPVLIFPDFNSLPTACAI